MSVAEVVYHLLAYYVRMSLQCRIILVSQLGSNLIAYVNQLTERGIIKRIFSIVTKCSSIPLSIKFLNLVRRWQGISINIYNSCIRNRKLIHAAK